MPNVLELDLDEPNKLQDCGIARMSFEPPLGVLALETDQGAIPIAINHTTAAMLILELTEFLAEREGDNKTEH